MGIITHKIRLFKYIENNQVNKFVQALKFTGSVNLKNKDGNTLLICAVLYNRIELVKILLNGGADPNRSNDILQNNNNTSPLHCAAQKDYHDIIKLLLEYGAQPDVEDIKALTPLHRACKYGSLQSTRALIAGGANVNAITVFNTQPLHYAAERGYEDIVLVLLQHNASIDGIEADEKPPLYWAVRGLHIKTAGILYTHGAGSDFLKLTELQKNILAGEELNMEGEDLNTTDIFGRTVLFYAISSGNTGLTKKLIELGCNTEIEDINEMKAWEYTRESV